MTNREPRYAEITAKLAERIQSGELRPDSPVGSESQLCQEFGVSRPTVRRAIAELTSRGLVVAVPGKGTYVCGSTMPSETKPVISFIVPHLQTPFTGEVYRGIQSVAEQHGYAVAVYGSDWRIAMENENIRLAVSRGESGTIIFPNWGRSNYADLVDLKKMGFPFVLVDSFFKDLPTDYVVVDNVMGAYEAVEHLIDLGHTNIAHIMGKPRAANEARLEGYRQALDHHGIAFRPEMVVSIDQPAYKDNEPGEMVGEEETIELLSRPNRPTAIFAGNDFIALGVIKAAGTMGLKVPEDLAIVGFDDLDFASWPGIELTTVAQPKVRIGEAAAELLIGKIEARLRNPNPGIRQIVLPTSLVIRSTSGKPI